MIRIALNGGDTMRKLLRPLLLLVIILGTSVGVRAQATNVYIAMTAAGSANGSSCANAYGYTFFNTSANWGTGSGQIGPGTTVNLCGTFTGAANGTLLVFQGSGASGNPITLLFGTGATLTSPVWLNNNDATSGAINTNNQSYLVINGGPTCGWNQVTLTTTACNGSIQNTQNGTSLTYQNATVGIDVVGGTHNTIKNLAFNNLYVRTGDLEEDGNFNQQHAIFFEQTLGTGPTYTTVTDNTFSYGGWQISDNSVDSDYLTIGPGNDFGYSEHDFNGAEPHFWFFGNHMHDWAIWDSTTDAYHHDGVHCYDGGGGFTQFAYIYNNQFDGATGANFNQAIFLEGNTSTTRCMLPGGTAYIFNNVAIINGESPAIAAIYGNATTGDVNDVFANNTIINSQPTATQSCMNFQNSSNTTVANNAVSGCGELVGAGGVLTTTYSKFNNDFYQNCSSFNCFAAAGVDSGSFATWQAGSCTGAANTCDPNGAANLTSTTYFSLGSGCVPGSLAANCAPTGGSPLVGAGANLFSLCNGQPVPGLGALCSDINGVVRPSSGAWTVGALAESGTPAAATPVIEPVSGAYTSPQTISMSCSTPSSTIYYTTDGSTPTSASTVYSGGFSQAIPATVQAICEASGYTNSGIASNVYTVPTSGFGTPIISKAICGAFNTCAVTVPATGTSHLLFAVGTFGGVGIHITGMSGGSTGALNSGPGAWYHPADGGGQGATASCNPSGAGSNSADCAYVLTSTAGSTTITFTLSGVPTGSTCWVYEVPYGNNPIQAELPISAYQTPSGTTTTGAALWLSGANDIIFQAISPAQFVTAISGGYTISTASTGPAVAYLENSTNGVAPTWTQNTSPATGSVFGMAFKQYQAVTGGLNTQWAIFNRANSGADNEECFTNGNISTSSAGLNLQSQLQSSTCASIDEATQGYSYTSGYIAMRSFNFLYGTIEFRGKFGGGTGSGSWPAVWMNDAGCQPSDPTGTDANCNLQEIDMTEVYGTFTNVNQQIHTPNFGNHNDGCTATTSDVSQNYHTYDLIWSAGSLVWQIDGVTTCTITESYVPNAAMYVKIDGFMGGTTGGMIDNGDLPWTTNIQYLKVTQGSTVVFSDTFSATTPTVSLSPASLTFGSQTVGTQSASQTITLTNTGTSAVAISLPATFVGTNPADFLFTTSSSPCPATLAAGASCQTNVAFKPTTSGTRIASVSFTDSAAGSPQTVPLSGTGVVGGIWSLAHPVATVVTDTTTTCTANLGSAPSTGDVMGVAVTGNTGVIGGASLTSVKDSAGNTYTLSSANTGSPNPAGWDGSVLWLGYLIAPSGATGTITATFAASVNVCEMWVRDYTLEAGYSAVFDQFVSGYGASAASVTTPSITPANSGELLWGAAIVSGSVSSVNSPFSGTITSIADADAYDLSATGATPLSMSLVSAANYISLLGAFNATSGSSPPTISSLSLSSGNIGATFTINGSNFGVSQGGSTATLNGTNLTVNTWSATAISVTVPSGGSTGNVIVTVSSVLSNGVLFTVTPFLSSVATSPNPVGTSVTVTGTGFTATQGSSSLTFNGSACMPTSWSATSITCVVPGPATTGNLVATVGGSPSNALSFTVSPALTSLSAVSGPIGSAVTLTGTTFGATQSTSTVKFNGTAATCPTWAASSISCSVPTGATTGSVIVTVASQASNGITFTVTTSPSSPVITSVTPGAGLTGVAITIVGMNFGATQGISTLTFNGVPCIPTIWTNTSVTCPVPGGITSGLIILTTSAGASNGVSFTVIPAVYLQLSGYLLISGGIFR
jgi:hypothetical protein